VRISVRAAREMESSPSYAVERGGFKIR